MAKKKTQEPLPDMSRVFRGLSVNSPSKPEPSFEERVGERFKTLEARIDLLEKELAALAKKGKE